MTMDFERTTIEPGLDVNVNSVIVFLMQLTFNTPKHMKNVMTMYPTNEIYRLRRKIVDARVSFLVHMV